jgi:hypothetical protein
MLQVELPIIGLIVIEATPTTSRTCYNDLGGFYIGRLERYMYQNHLEASNHKLLQNKLGCLVAIGQVVKPVYIGAITRNIVGTCDASSPIGGACRIIIRTYNE